MMDEPEPYVGIKCKECGQWVERLSWRRERAANYLAAIVTLGVWGLATWLGLCGHPWLCLLFVGIGCSVRVRTRS